jgi:hypothetical protein
MDHIRVRLKGDYRYRNRLAGLLLLVGLMLFCIPAANAASLFRKQSGTVTLAVGATSVNVTIQTVTMSRTFMVFTVSLNDATPSSSLIGGEITNATQLTFTRDGNATAATIKWQVFEFASGVTVQHGSTGNVGNPTDVAITSVNLAKTFVIASCRNDGSNFGSDDSFTANFQNATSLRLTAPGSGLTRVYWQVVQYEDANVQRVTATIANGSASNTSAITSVNLAKTMVISNHSIGDDVNADDMPRTELTNATTVTYTRVGTTNAMSFVTYVVEFTDETIVTRGSESFSSGATSGNVAVTASLTGSAIIPPGNQMRQGSTSFATTDNVGHNWFFYEITAVPTLNIQRAVGTGSTAIAPWQLVTFTHDVRTYYSAVSGAWENSSVWSSTSDGLTPVPAGEYPSRVDNVVIRTGHTITVDAETDNYYPGVRPDDLGIATANNFETSNVTHFFHSGNILINGTLSITPVRATLGGYTRISTGGVLTTGSNLVNIGYLEADAGSSLSSLDDFILSGNSTTLINTNSTSSDDIILDHSAATLCGTGTTQLNNGAGSIISYSNGATISQICSQFTVTCPGIGCAGTFPTAGTGVVVVGNTGPAGVGYNNGTSALKLWFRPDNGLTATASRVDSWTNSAGIAALDLSETTTQRPTLITNALNGFPEISFDGSNRLRSAQSLTSSNFITNKASSFVVARADNTGQTSSVYLTDPLDVNRFSNHLPWAGTVYYDIGQCCGTDARINISGLSGLTGYSIWSYTAALAPGKELFRNGASIVTAASVSSFNNWGNYRFNIGGNIAGSAGFVGDVAEMIIYNERVNTAQRILVDNYLSAKYNLPLAANDVYAFDAGINFDYDVAGIGMAADLTYHRDAQGTGIVRIWNPTDLGSGEYLLFGHNNQTLNSTTTAVGTDVDGTIIKERLRRIWVASETGEVGTISLSFDFSSLGGSPIGSNLRLLIDRDGDGFQDNDVTPIAGSVINNVAVFNVNFANGDRFTLGNTDNTNPLPITLLDFRATVVKETVQINWSTATEIDNDYFEVMSSGDGETWYPVARVEGAGNSTVRLDYEVADENPVNGTNYYRLKQTDYDGRFSFSKVVAVKLARAEVFKAWPNPSPGVYTISLRNVSPEQIKVINTIGQSVRFTYRNDAGTTIDISDQAEGIYFIQVSDGESVRTIRVAKSL